ncbi:histamine H1 receptor [Pygocentrus nattereri]|uniref:Muscarinic acetylcholine receptor n=1 Tax=Pygocentrus nattereri TaxID=42514 RepID=A0A3B4BR71_PYGNA|nr:histamine H1 receptor [Pygocentrus nattereri]
METTPYSRVKKILQDHSNLSSTAYSNVSTPFHHHMNNAMLGILLGMLSLLTVIMNILVLFAVRNERTLHTVGNLYIVSLSLADLIVGATVMPLNMVYLLEDEWRLGRVVCQFWLVMDYVASTASIFSLFILCLDRYRSVRQPLKYLKYRTRGRATLMICAAWLLSMTWIIPILGWRMFAHVDRKPELESKCDTDFRFVTWFKVLTAILNFYIPSFLMLWFYSQIFIAVREHYKQWESITCPRVPTDQDGTIQNSNQLQRTFYKPSEKENLALRATFSKNDGILDQYTLEQPFSSKDTNEEIDDSSLDEKKPKNRKTSFFNISKRKRKSVRELNEISSMSQEEDIEDEASSKEPSFPLRFLHCEENDELKMFVSVNDCNVLVPNSVANICEITPTTDVHKYTTVLCSDDVAQSPTSPWGHSTSPPMDTSNTLTLKQTWQKFCVQSRQCVQNMRVHKERKAARQLGFIIGTFMVCWIPYFITFMVMALCNTCVHHDLHMFTIWLGYINSTLNPFIYPLCNENFKRVFKKIFHIKQ